MNHLDKPLFVYGTMLDRDVAEIVLGRVLDPARVCRAWLDGYRVVRIRDDTYPMLIEAPGEHVAGAVIHDLDRTALDRVRFFESYEYDFVECTVRIPDHGYRRAARFGAAHEPPQQPEPWSLEWWRATHKDRFLRYVRDFMAFYGCGTLDEAEARWLELEREDERRARQRTQSASAN
ncbi:MAG: gamma-glutamylcyclotransferase [Gammaproteobacteria bacterium]|nr:gamma-glutamylcyclotransferase [Gammaproteobacteria bacterium]NIR84818.1 gamma-glutamylcyclotransferase [Gammaproteobacteria bacterium]NIR91532.1 gamma-glutamylcyclotransferase [Gammaproteobacteria bacterium]NIU05865.1 gamma-glutamylcyclotransferase [Gammaproteobacteria bacterium]NIV76720.1 hypothetical protein [Gammaproteobacteria bacterium]